MANTGRIAGKDVYVTFAGTDLSPDFTSVSVNNEGELVDVTAGSDTYHYFVSLARVNGTVDYECFYNGGTTTEWEAIAPNTAGTLIIAPRAPQPGILAGLARERWFRIRISTFRLTTGSR